jgi:methyl-accepting chemotaxis protein
MAVPFAFARTIGGRLTGVIVGTLTLAALGSGIGVYALDTVAAKTDTIARQAVGTERLIADWYSNTYMSVRRTTAIGVSADPTLADYFAEETKTVTQSTNEIQRKVEALMATPEEKTLYAQIGDMRKVYLGARDAVVALKKAGDAEGARRKVDEALVPASQKYIQALNALKDHERARLDADAAEVQAVNQRARWALIAFTLASTLLGLTLGLLLVRSITRPVKAAVATAQRIAGLDLTQPVEVRGTGETAELLGALARMQQALRELVHEVRSSTESISTASSQIAAGNTDLSQRTEEAAANLQQTAASIEQMNGTVQNSAGNARTADQLATSAAQVAEQGGQKVAEVVATMGEIDSSSRRIADIIGVIDGIAFQTNILALNAAVEAARAGEQGRGFAVVAGEVRTLAQRSAEAAKEIKTLIGASVERVDAGTRLVQDAGRTMGDIVLSVKRVSDIIAELSHAAAEQGQGIGQVNTAVAQLDQVTQQNASLVEESAAAAQSLNQQAATLQQTVARFAV